MYNPKLILKTANFNTVNVLCEEAKSRSKMIALIGYPGAGKTTALEAYKNLNDHVYYVRVTASMTAKHFYSEILKSMGQHGMGNGTQLYNLIKEICYRLCYTNTKKLLIIDEAGKFKPKFLEYIHELRDNTMGNTGIILAGPEYFQKNIITWMNKGIVGIPEVYRRVNHWQKLEFPNKDEKIAICKAQDITESEIIRDIITDSFSFSDLDRNIEEYHLSLKKKK